MYADDENIKSFTERNSDEGDTGGKVPVLVLHQNRHVILVATAGHPKTAGFDRRASHPLTMPAKI